MFSAFDTACMQRALVLAMLAQAQGEVPVGAVLTYNDSIIAEAYNQPIRHHDPTAHAEVLALRLGAQYFQNYRLINTTLYTTLEPCCMCAGAMLHARVKRVVFATPDPRGGAGGSAFNLLQSSVLNHRIEVTCGLYAAASQRLLQQFFKRKRGKMNHPKTMDSG